jgi:hypothetical protein
MGYPNWCAAVPPSSLTLLEDKIVVLDPAKTELVADPSSNFNSTFLYLEAQLRRSTPNDDQIHLVLLRHRFAREPSRG